MKDPAEGIEFQTTLGAVFRVTVETLTNQQWSNALFEELNLRRVSLACLSGRQNNEQRDETGNHQEPRRKP